MSRVLQARAFWWLLAALGLVVYGLRGWHNANVQRPVFDEGLYLYKGWLWVQGEYRPFEPYGPWSNRMPLALGIYGLAQQAFGPGLTTGRAFSLAFSALGVVALWALTRRWAGDRWAAWIPWAAASVPVWMEAYALAVSQSLAFGMTALTLALVLTHQPHPVAWALGGGVAGALAVTRLNMTPVFLALGAWLAWHWGRRSLWFWVPALGVFLGVHAWFWPDIMTLWVKWFPRAWTPFLDPWRPPIGGEVVWNPQYTLATRAHEAVAVLRRYWLSGVAWLLGLVAWWQARRGQDRWYVLGVLVTLLAVLGFLHVGATLGHPRNVRALVVYAAFFAPVALPLVPLALPEVRSLERGPGAWAAWAVVLVPPVLLGMEQPILLVRARVLLGLKVRQALGDALYLGLRDGLLFWLPPAWRAPVLGLLLAAPLVLLGIGLGVWAVRWVRGRAPRRYGLGFWAAGLALVMTVGLAWPQALGGLGYRCPESRPLDRVPLLARQLARWLQPGDRVFGFYGERLLFLLEPGFPRVVTFPQQYNSVYNFRRGGDPDVLARWGYWNDALARRWVQQADVLLLTSAERARWLQEEPGAWRLVGVLPALNPCDAQAGPLWVYRRSR